MAAAGPVVAGGLTSQECLCVVRRVRRHVCVKFTTAATQVWTLNTPPALDSSWTAADVTSDNSLKEFRVSAAFHAVKNELAVFQEASRPPRRPLWALLAVWLCSGWMNGAFGSLAGPPWGAEPRGSQMTLSVQAGQNSLSCTDYQQNIKIRSDCFHQLQKYLVHLLSVCCDFWPLTSAPMAACNVGDLGAEAVSTLWHHFEQTRMLYECQPDFSCTLLNQSEDILYIWLVLIKIFYWFHWSESVSHRLKQK